MKKMVKMCWNSLLAQLLVAVGVMTILCECTILDTSTELNHMVKLPNGGLVVGAVNYLYAVDGDLNVKQNVSTGPVNDVINSNEILSIYGSKLITCGSVNQGICQFRKISDLADSSSFNHRVAANAPETSSVGVVIPGKDAICVGAQADGYAVATRTLTGQYTLRTSYRNSALRLSQDKPFMSYKFGFHRGSYTYFLVHQKLPNDKSVIARVCDDDETYYSYIEIPLECKRGSAVYDVVNAGTVTTVGTNLASALGITTATELLAAVFHKSNEPGKSAVCFYSFDDIERKINENGNKCFQGGLSTNAGHYSVGSRTCTSLITSQDYSTISCGQLANDNNYQDNTPVVGTIPVSSKLTVEVDGTLSSVAIKTVYEHTVAYTGTIDGLLKKTHIKSTSDWNTFEDIDLRDGHGGVKADMLFNNNTTKRHLYVMSGTKLHKVPSYDCSKYTSCGDCVALRDPHCGWCTLENKCSLSTECHAVGQPNKWYPFTTNPAQCTVFSNVAPDNLSRNADPVTITLTVSNLPALPADNSYTCVFGDHVATPATVTQSGVSCRTPDRPLIPEERHADHIVVPVSLNSSEYGVLFVSRNFTFFSCESHTQCTPCTQSAWGCRWCVLDHKCVHTTDGATCLPAIATTDDKCPRIEPSTPKILLPSGFSKEIVLKTKELPDPGAGQSGYECKVRINDQTFTTNAVRQGDDVTCQAKDQYTYPETVQKKNVSISLVWNGSFNIDNPSNVGAEMYKCPLMGHNCGVCLSIGDSYKCSWTHECGYVSTGVKNPCPTINIKKVSPLNTTLEGGTTVTLEGENLGYSRTSVANAVKLAGVLCESIGSNYVISKKIVCRAGRSSKPNSGEVVLTVDGVAGKYGSEFEYRDPVITEVNPQIGPKSGGTILTIDGTSFDTLNYHDFSVKLNGVPCDTLQRTDNKTLCILHGTDSPGNVSSLVMKFANEAERDLAQFTYLYTPDPTIKDITPLKAFAAGGRNITVTGNYFTSIQEPKMYAKRGREKSVKTLCHIHNITTMICPSPEVPSIFTSTVRRRRAGSNEIVVGFVMDNVTEVQDLTENFPNVTSTIKFVVNPVFYNFTEKDSIKILKEDQLIIEGENLNLASTEEEVVVQIGTKLCNVTSLAKTQLVCTTPEIQPEGLDKDGKRSKNALPNVTVSVGNLKFELGQVKYYIHVLDTGIIIGIVVSITVLVAIIIIIIFIFRRKSHRAQRDYKKIQIQLDTMESNVRNECKQAFAELQTDMSDLTSDLVATGIPFLEYDAYIFKVLFPGLKEHSTYHGVMDQDESQFDGMDQFEQLILNKTFLLMLIRTLEQQKTFTIRDKANVASLLMIALLDKMEYATEILKTLLGELIDKYMEQKNPKIMLRRTDSVVEKMLTNWLSICMYSYLQETPGNSLFIMFKSIKHQLAKGPVDAITCDARYSLSEDRLLREKIEPRTLTLEVVLDNDEHIPDVKVLDCDSVTQVKEKILDAIYRNTAYSQRPSPYDIELEWRQGRAGHLTLADDDVTTFTEDGWKKLNTLEHYRVSDPAVMALLPRQHNAAKTNNNGSISSNTPFANDAENGAKCWHLVKSEDMVEKEKEGKPKAIPEIYLARLLSTKGTLQKFVDDLFQNILSVSDQLPPAVKYLFDFLDDSARQHGIHDPEVVYTWKSNSLPLRFWVNIIKNPDFVFDVKKSNIVDASLSVIAQTFMDSCSRSEYKLTKDSPTNKLLFAKEIPRYRGYVESFYTGVQQLSPLSEQEMHSAMVDISRKAPSSFFKPAALKEMYDYVLKYENEIMDSLEEDRVSTSLQLPQKLKRVDLSIHGGPVKT